MSKNRLRDYFEHPIKNWDMQETRWKPARKEKQGMGLMVRAVDALRPTGLSITK